MRIQYSTEGHVDVADDATDADIRAAIVNAMTAPDTIRYLSDADAARAAALAGKLLDALPAQARRHLDGPA